MTKAVRVHKVGGPEALVYEAVDVPAPGPGEVRIRQYAVGLNFIDVYYRTGLYKAPGLPFIAGNEAAGEVVAVVAEDVLLRDRAGRDVEETGVRRAHALSVPAPAKRVCNLSVKLGNSGVRNQVRGVCEPGS